MAGGMVISCLIYWGAVATMRVMNIRRCLLRAVVVAVVCGAGPAISRHFVRGGGIAVAQGSLPSSHQGTFELEESLFVQDPHFTKGAKGIQVIWIPQPIQKYCLGKTSQECSTIDYCIRTTNKQVAMCQNLSANLRHLPAYPPDMVPRRVLSVVLLFPMTPDRGFGDLIKFFNGAPAGSLDRISASARIKAKVKLTRTPDDDQLQLLEVLAVPSS